MPLPDSVTACRGQNRMLLQSHRCSAILAQALCHLFLRQKVVCVPNRSTKSAARKREQKKRWFRNGQKWRTGCEGRISVVKRRHGLNRCRDKGDDGMTRWVGLGVIADNIINIGTALAKRSAEAKAEAQSKHTA